MITASGFELNTFNFPAGEPHVRITNYRSYAGANILYSHTFGNDLPRELLQLQLIGDALNRHNIPLNDIRIGYAPFGRQDRIAVEGDALSVQLFANIINSLNAKTVHLEDPHSDVLPALLNRCIVVSQWILLRPYFSIRYLNRAPFFIVVPDAGAAKKISPLLSSFEHLYQPEVLQCTKQRDPTTGALSQFALHQAIPNQWIDTEHVDAVIIDDICDGGGTFVAIAELLKDEGHFGKIILVVSHGLFTKGIEALHNIDEVYVRGTRVK